MGKNISKSRSRHGLQVVTLCISTALVLILLGMVVMSVFTAKNLTTYIKENLVVTMMLEQDMTNSEASKLCSKLKYRPYIKHLDFISKEQALREQTIAMGSDPTEFMGGSNPFLSSIEITLRGDYANSDSLKWIESELKKYPKVSDLTYPQDLINNVNTTISKISIVLLALAILLTFVSFSLINNTVRLSIYSRRFSIHTMKLVGASWGFIRAPFIKSAVWIGVIAAFIAIALIALGVSALYNYEPDILQVLTPEVMLITAFAVLLFGILITAICASISVNKFLKMKAGELYKI